MQALIRRRLCRDENLRGLLSSFNDEPAIFYRKSPSDSEFFGDVYPHIVFSVDKFSDPIKGVSGLLTIDVICDQTHCTPEEIEPHVRAGLEGFFFKPTDGEIFSVKWQRTDVFSEPASERLPLIVGATLTFEVYEFPSAVTSEPDPVLALSLWAQSTFTNAVIIGLTDFGEEFKPDRGRPAFYFDTELIRLKQNSSTVIFVTATINAHVFCDGVTARREHLAALHFAILRRSTFMLENESPLRLTDATLDFAKSDIQGQLSIVADYGVERFYPYSHPLAKVVVR